MWKVQGFVLQSIGKYVTAEGERAILFWAGTEAQQVILHSILIHFILKNYYGIFLDILK
jgi:hypothetical protein